MYKHILLLPLLVIAFSQSLSISPEFTYQYESDNEQYSAEDLAIQDFDFVIRGIYQNNNLQILGRMGYHLTDGTLLNPRDFTRAQGFQYFVQDKGLENQKNYYISDMQLHYGDSASYYYLDKWDKHWGPGINSLTISNKIPSFLHFGFKWQLQENIRFEYFHGKLKSNIDDTLYAGYYDYVGYNPIDINRNIVGHRIEWKPFKHIVISGSELIVYANRELELTYLLPFVPFFPIQSYIGETDNVIMSGDIQYLPNENVRVYGVFLMDEWAPTYTFKEDNNNWFGWQTGFEWKNAILPKSRLRMEYTWTDHRIYRHRFPVNDYSSWEYPVGFWAGPHAQEIYADYSFSYGKSNFKIMFSDAKRGKLTRYMLEEQYSTPSETRLIYERFSGGTEEKRVIFLTLNRNITEKIDLNVSYTFVDWENAGFNPEVPLLEEDLPDITKHSMGIAIRYGF
jgi:hypothetical protein